MCRMERLSACRRAGSSRFKLFCDGVNTFQKKGEEGRVAAEPRPLMKDIRDIMGQQQEGWPAVGSEGKKGRG